jgi:hypothetical protein
VAEFAEAQVGLPERKHAADVERFDDGATCHLVEFHETNTLGITQDL